MAVVEALMSVPQLPPIIPFEMWQEPDGRWKKKAVGVTTWEQRSADRRQLERWWRLYPNARPGIPLRGSGLVVLDVDDPGDPAFRRCWDGPPIGGVRVRYRDREDGYSLWRTPSGGYHILYAQCDPPITKKIEWSPSVEVIGANGLFVCHDLRELASPRRRQREVLPEVFRERFAGAGYGRHLRIDIGDVHRGDVPLVGGHVVGAEEVEVYTAALLAMDPADWIPRAGEETASYAEWFGFVGGCKAVGIPRDVFVEWQTRVPRYANDGREIERIWDSAHGRHGGAFFRAVAARRIKLIFKPTKPSDTGCVCPEVPPLTHNSKSTLPGHNSNPTLPGVNSKSTLPGRQRTISWRDRVAKWTSILHGDQTERTLFTAACFIAEISAECGQPTLAFGQERLEASCPKLIRQIGIEEVRRTIRRAFDHVASKLKEANNA
jgi:hypothetical protein